MAKTKVEDIQFTAFTESKIRTFFKMIDVGKDGCTCREDFQTIADRFVKEYGLHDKKAKEIRDWLMDGWAIIIESEPREDIQEKMPLVLRMVDIMRSGEKITEDDFTQAYGQLIKANPELAKTSLEKMVEAFFEVYDHDKDNYIDESELMVAMRCFGFEHLDRVHVAFKCMDLDQDGKLSRDEYVGGWVDFILGQDKENGFTRAFAPQLLE